MGKRGSAVRTRLVLDYFLQPTPVYSHEWCRIGELVVTIALSL